MRHERDVYKRQLPDGPWNFGSSVLKQGSTGSEVEQMQFWLSTLAQYESSIPSVSYTHLSVSFWPRALIRVSRRSDMNIGLAQKAVTPAAFASTSGSAARAS